jgi:uncharacterized protein
LKFERVSVFDCPAAELGAWHFRAGAIHRLIPPWESIEVVREAAPLVNGAIAEIRIRKGPIRTTLLACHECVEPPRRFVDAQQSGPFRSWRHEHTFTDVDGKAELRDSIVFELPLGGIGRVLLGGRMLAEIDRQFRFRHERTRADLRRHAELHARFGSAALRVGVTGASGLVGRQFCAMLSTGGHDVVRFVRGKATGPGEIAWNARDVENGVDPRALEGLDAIVHLAGAGIAEQRWSPERKREILESRTFGTQAIARAIARCAQPPRALISASAIGFYGNRPDGVMDESSTRGEGYLADVTAAWEGATQAAESAGVRVVHARVGVVLTASGGALAKMLTPFLLGAGGPIGHGRQGFSWISLDDVIGALLFLLRDGSVHGAVNLVAPMALPQRGFAGVLGRVLRRPSFAPLPAPIVRLMFGEMGQRLLLEGALVRPSVLESRGFRFEHGSLEQALRFELGRMPRETARS